MKWIKYIIIITFFFSIINIMTVVNADSGWDSSYDSGGSWDSGSSWDSDWSSSSTGGGIYVSGDGLESLGFGGTMFVIIIIVIILVFSTKMKQIQTNHYPNKKYYYGLTDEEIKQKDQTLEKEQLLKEAFHIYYEVQNAWMNFDDTTLRNHVTDELYNMYASQLKTLKIKNQQNIMKDIVLNESKITEINIHNNIEEVKVYLNVSQYDYVIDKNKKVLRGSEQYKNNVDYIITLVRHLDENKQDKCPNCGAPIDFISSGVCPYCDSTILNKTDQFIMSKKECVGQWKER